MLFSFLYTFITNERLFSVLTKIRKDRAPIIIFPLIVKIIVHNFSLQSFSQPHTTVQSKDYLYIHDVGIIYRKNNFKYQTNLQTEAFTIVSVLTLIFCLLD